MQYVAAVSGKGWEVDRVKEQLLQSNPVLEGTCQLESAAPISTCINIIVLLTILHIFLMLLVGRFCLKINLRHFIFIDYFLYSPDLNV